MLIGTLGVGLLYLGINWVFIANLTPDLAAGVMSYEQTRVTLAHLVSIELAGPIGGHITSGLAIITFISAMSAMTMIGPRVYAAMAADGFLPKSLAMQADKPPFGGVLLQGAIALLFLWTHSIREAVGECVDRLDGVYRSSPCLYGLSPRKRQGSPITADFRPRHRGSFAAIQLGLIGVGFTMSKLLTLEVLGMLTIGFVAYLLSTRSSQAARTSPTNRA